MPHSTLRRQVAERAGQRCEYCKTPHAVTAQPFHLDHILPRSLGGDTSLDNLCFACPRCNYLKGAKTQGEDPHSGQAAELFNPRTDRWGEHFTWDEDGHTVKGCSATGRATVDVLQLNAEIMLRARAMWRELGLLP